MSGELLIFVGTMSLVFAFRALAVFGTWFYAIVASGCYAWAFHLATN